MKIQSLIRDQDRLVPVEVELSFIPGLPQIQFLGLPDQAIRESIHRIKSAIRAQGFDFPKAQQILVNLRPAHLKKNSRGLELAVALGVLWESEQIPKPLADSVLVYGELSLGGEVYEPEDLFESFDNEAAWVWTGKPQQASAPFGRSTILQLKDIHSPNHIKPAPREYKIERPFSGLDLVFPERQAEILKLTALGEHSLLLAGPSGSGKTTMSKTLLSLLAAPTAEDMREIVANNKDTSTQEMKWRPLVHPHHTTPPLGLIGGGVPPFKGEITRAHRGVLVLDELLEFHPKSQEVLREPMEDGRIRIRRGRFLEEHIADTLFVATTNLCPCGDWVPKARVMCGRSLKKCRSYAERLSGPLVDRFQLIFFTQRNERGEGVLGADILKDLEKARRLRAEWAKTDRRFLKVTTKWTWDELIQDLPEFYMRELFPKELASRRRDLATLKIARSYADLDGMAKMQPQHVERALKVTFVPFDALKRLGD
ncbi:competence protein ComM [Bdellovibrio bacteriovorus]|uniref:Competence protein ComM n=1 Tax=Bdellovibrio bacteriovorus TaxID=959 RepID=A0A150WHT4_BDEBC|nr:ATP-binding protein [Bdellovibrio bacteriovorus]KYG63180.1 competence protein ComM [Bdellovibrio bacteriovorus]